jgi:hypothetical protein
MQLNFQLFNNFKEAAQKCNLEVKSGPGHYTIRLENGRYIYCWTPLNKMFALYNYYEKKEWDRALDYLKDNFDDFHLEFGGDTIEDMNVVCEAFITEGYDKNITVNKIIECIEILQDDEKLNQKLFWTRLKYDLE